MAFLLIVVTMQTSIAQKKIKCKSGQQLELTAQGLVISTTSSDLLSKHLDKDSLWIEAYRILLINEMNNRITFTEKENEIVLLEYEKTRRKEEEKMYNGKIQSIKRELQSLDKSYNQNYIEIKKLTSSNIAERNLVISKLMTPVEDVPTQDFSTGETDQILEAAPNPSATVEMEIPVVKNEVKKEEKKKHKKQIGHCEILFNGRDERSGKKQTVLQQDELFTYTPEKMLNYFRLDNYLSGNLSLEKLDGKLIFNFELKFNSKDVQKSYGVINKKDFIRIDFITGRQIFLTAVEVEDPFIENYTGNTIYRAKYELNEHADVDFLRKFFIDKIGILWSSGYESYTVYKVDFLKEKMNCLDQIN